MFQTIAILYIWILSDVWMQLFQNFWSQLHICSLQSIILFQYNIETTESHRVNAIKICINHSNTVITLIAVYIQC